MDGMKHWEITGMQGGHNNRAYDPSSRTDGLWGARTVADVCRDNELEIYFQNAQAAHGDDRGNQWHVRLELIAGVVEAYVDKTTGSVNITKDIDYQDYRAMTRDYSTESIPDGSGNGGDYRIPQQSSVSQSAGRQRPPQHIRNQTPYVVQSYPCGCVYLSNGQIGSVCNQHKQGIIKQVMSCGCQLDKHGRRVTFCQAHVNMPKLDGATVSQTRQEVKPPVSRPQKPVAQSARSNNYPSSSAKVTSISVNTTCGCKFGRFGERLYTCSSHSPTQRLGSLYCGCLISNGVIVKTCNSHTYPTVWKGHGR